MALARTHRRRIVVAGAPYVWWIAADDECAIDPGRPKLTIATDDRRVYVAYHLARPPGQRMVTVVGPAFRGVVVRGAAFFRAPDFAIDVAVQPSHVAAVVAWITEAGPLPATLDCYGREVAGP